MGVGTRCREGPWHPWILKISAKERCFLNYEWEKTNSTIFGPPGKILEIPLVPSLEKILPTLMNPSFILFLTEHGTDVSQHEKLRSVVHLVNRGVNDSFANSLTNFCTDCNRAGRFKNGGQNASL